MVFECIATESQLAPVAKRVADALMQHKVLLLHGEVGAGKTTLVKLITKELGSASVGSSPTFSLINDYPIKNNFILHHLDLYRLNNEAEVYDIGLEEILDSGNPTIIEWPELALNLIADPYLELTISHLEGERKYQLVLKEHA